MGYCAYCALLFIRYLFLCYMLENLLCCTFRKLSFSGRLIWHTPSALAHFRWCFERAFRMLFFILWQKNIENYRKSSFFVMPTKNALWKWKVEGVTESSCRQADNRAEHLLEQSLFDIKEPFHAKFQLLYPSPTVFYNSITFQNIFAFLFANFLFPLWNITDHFTGIIVSFVIIVLIIVKPIILSFLY